MRPKLQEEDSEITKMSIFMLNYYQDAEAHIDKLEKALNKIHKSMVFMNHEYWANMVKQALK